VVFSEPFAYFCFKTSPSDKFFGSVHPQTDHGLAERGIRLNQEKYLLIRSALINLNSFSPAILSRTLCEVEKKNIEPKINYFPKE